MRISTRDRFKHLRELALYLNDKEALRHLDALERLVQDQRKRLQSYIWKHGELENPAGRARTQTHPGLGRPVVPGLGTQQHE